MCRELGDLVLRVVRYLETLFCSVRVMDSDNAFVQHIIESNARHQQAGLCVGLRMLDYLNDRLLLLNDAGRYEHFLWTIIESEFGYLKSKLFHNLTVHSYDFNVASYIKSLFI